jgi:putative redox protein
MKVYLKQIEGLSLAARGESNHWVVMDGARQFGGSKAASSPMELVLMALAGCTSMDVLSILQKMRQSLSDYRVVVKAERAEEHPKVYTRIHIDYYFWGDQVEEKNVQRAIELSQTKYCSVSIMLKKTAELTYAYHINEPIPEDDLPQP